MPPGRDPIDTADQLQFVLDRLADLPAALRQTLADHQWTTIPLTVDEFASSPNLAAGATLVVQAQTSGLELIECIVASVPAGATGTIQLGPLQIPLLAGVTTIAPCRKLLATSDNRTLTIAGAAGGAALWLSGQQLPTFGVLAP